MIKLNFSIGDRIIIRYRAHDISIPGYRGTVVDFMFDLIGVEFDKEIPKDLVPESERHDCNNHGKRGYCRYCYSTDLELIPNDWDE